MKIAIVRTQRFELNELTESEELIMTDIQVQERLIDGMPFFRRLGGYESVQRNYTPAGYLPVKMISKSPDRQIKVIRLIEWPSVVHVYIRRRMYFVNKSKKLVYGYRDSKGKFLLFESPKKATRTMLERAK